MGIRFACHHCSHAIHVKDFQGGKRGKCPECGQSFRIPLQDATYSLAIDEEQGEPIPQIAAAIASPKSAAVHAKSAVVAPTQTAPKPQPAVDSVKAAKPIEKSISKSSDKPAAKPVAKQNVAPSSVPPSAPPVNTKVRPRAFAEADGARWYVRPPSGGEYGPASEELLTVWIEEKRVTADSLLWREGQPQWLTAEQLLPELYPADSDFYEEPNRRHTDSDSTIGFPEMPSTGPAIASELESAAKPSPAALLKAQRKQRQKRNQWLLIGVLSLISLLLLGGLVWVLMFNTSNG
ncbi:GYF domain-containing protein [Pirellulaceae bacterium SH467]